MMEIKEAAKILFPLLRTQGWYKVTEALECELVKLMLHETDHQIQLAATRAKMNRNTLSMKCIKFGIERPPEELLQKTAKRQERLKMVLELRANGLTHAQISQALGVTKTTVRDDIERAKNA